MDEDISLLDVVQVYKEELEQAYSRIVVLECRLKNRDREIERLKKDE